MPKDRVTHELQEADEASEVVEMTDTTRSSKMSTLSEAVWVSDQFCNPERPA